jgi:hypothetical protein
MEDEYLLEFDKNFSNFTITNITKLFCEQYNDTNVNPIQIQRHLKYL